MKHDRGLTAHTADGCDLLRLADVGMVAQLIRAASQNPVTDEERETFHCWMDARRCLHLSTLATSNDDLPLFDGQVFASVCTVCDRSTVLCIDERTKKFLTVEYGIPGTVPRSEPRQLNRETCKYARQLVMNAAISEVCTFDSAYRSPDFVIDAESFAKKWDAGLAMMGWQQVVSGTPPEFDGNPRLGAVLATGVLCETCADVVAVEMEDGEIRVVLCPFDG